MSNKLDPDQAQHFVRPDLDPICLQRLSADDTIRKRVYTMQISCSIIYFKMLEFQC